MIVAAAILLGSLAAPDGVAAGGAPRRGSPPFVGGPDGTGIIGSIGAVLQAQQVKGKEKGVWMHRYVHAAPKTTPSHHSYSHARVYTTGTSPSASSRASWSRRAS